MPWAFFHKQALTLNFSGRIQIWDWQRRLGKPWWCHQLLRQYVDHCTANGGLDATSEQVWRGFYPVLPKEPLSNPSIFDRTGDAVIFHLLSETSIYVPLPNDCFCQVTGPHLIYLPPPKSLPPAKEENEKRVVAQDTQSSKSSERKRKAEETDLSARPSKRPKTGPATIINRKKLASKKLACQPKTYVNWFCEVFNYSSLSLVMIGGVQLIFHSLD